MPIFDHFDLLAPIYDRVIRPIQPEKLLSLIGPLENERLLDAGGGTGRISQYLASYATSVVIADVSLGMLSQAIEKNGLEVVCSQTEMLPFEDESFGRITMVDAFHHVDDQSRTSGELWRVLKKGGKLVIEEPDIDHFAVKMVALAEKIALMRSHFLSPQKICACFAYPNAKTWIEREAHNAWIIVEKVK